MQQNVNNFNVTEQTEEINPDTYYREAVSVVSKEELDKAVEEAVKNIAKDSIWEMLGAIIDFFNALFTAFSIFDAHLSAAIDKNYYDENNGGFQSVKNVNYDSEYKDADANMSKAYKEILGEYGFEGEDADDGRDLGDILCEIFENIKKLSDSISDIGSSLVTFDFITLGKTLKNIGECAQKVMGSVNRVFAFLANMFTASNIYKKLLLTGYVNYNLSDRHTYGDKDLTALTGEKFNLRGQEIPEGLADVPVIGDLAALADTIVRGVTGRSGTDKCFYGAEKEYIFAGTKDEILNQTMVFGFIYLLRLVLDVGPILCNGEVASMAAAATIASPIVYVLVILVEPLIDTFLLTAGSDQKIGLIKGTIFLTPSGIQNLISHVTSLSFSSADLNAASNKFGEKFNMPAKKSFVDPRADILSVNYSTTLFLMLFVLHPGIKCLTVLRILLKWNPWKI